MPLWGWLMLGVFVPVAVGLVLWMGLVAQASRLLEELGERMPSPSSRPAREEVFL
jgi:hypothetical protein